MKIKLSEIIPAPWNTRGEITPESVKGLAESIEEQGLINPITVWKNDKKWLCIAGNRRLAALLSLHTTDYVLPVDYYTIFDGEEADAKVITVIENLQREDVSPIEEAALVQQCLDDGMTAEAVAAKTGRSVSWVNRRKRLIGLCDSFKADAAKFTADQLEKIASFEKSVQERVAEYYDADTDDWESVKRLLNNEAKDLANAKFDTAACHECLKRTGAQADLWGICDGCLGQCQYKACYEQKVKDAQEAKIAELTKGASEVVRVTNYWKMPGDLQSSPKKCKQHPCAYVNVDYRGDVIVKWGESKKAKDERKKKEAERREAKRAEERAASARDDGIVDVLDAWKDGDDNGDNSCVGLDDLIEREVGSKLESEVKEFVTDAVIDKIDSWQDAEKWARILRAFPAIAKLAGVSEDDAQYLIDNNPEEDDN